MVNNAGIAIGPTVIHEATEEEWDTLMNVNARSVFLGMKYAIAQMLKQDPHPTGDRGWIINMGSCAGLVGIPGTRKSSSMIFRRTIWNIFLLQKLRHTAQLRTLHQRALLFR